MWTDTRDGQTTRQDIADDALEFSFVDELFMYVIYELGLLATIWTGRCLLAEWRFGERRHSILPPKECTLKE